MTEDLAALLKACQAKGSDSQFRAWIQRQPSALSGTYSEYLESGEGRSVAAHVRRAGSSGIGYKAPYACIPLRQDEHHRQHTHGEAALAPKAWWDAKRIEYLRLWLAS